MSVPAGEDAAPISQQFVADNDRFKMGDALESLLTRNHIDVSSAFVDAYGISVLGGGAETGTVRLLVGYDLAEKPTDKDIVTFEMARTWRDTGEDPVDRRSNDEFVKIACRLLELPTYEVTKAARRTHSKLYVTEDVGIVGSSNLTASGLQGQRELNLLQHDPLAVARLRDWFEARWTEAKQSELADFKDELIKWLATTRMQRFAPFHPYAKAIFERYRHRFIASAATPGEVDLAVFQTEGRDTALGLLAERRCCIVADAVGFGKTFIALAAFQKRAQARPRNQRKLLVICPAQLEGVWNDAARDQGIPLETESMESLGVTTGAECERRLADLEQYALVIVDEAHNFRNHLTNRFGTLMRVLQGGPEDKEVLLLTATPINNGLGDLYNLYRLMAKDRDDFFESSNLRIASLKDFFKQVEKKQADTTDLLLESMVCRSRLDIRRRQEKGETIVISGQEVRFPDRRMISLDYSLGRTGSDLNYTQIAGTIENLILPAYNVEQYARVPDPTANQRYSHLQTIFKILLLKRLESSLASFVSTAERLLGFSDHVVGFLKAGRRLTNEDYRRLQGELALEFDEEDSGGSAYMQALVERDPVEYDVDRLERDMKHDRSLLQPLVQRAKMLQGPNDGKIAKLKEELARLLPDQKVLVFTAYSDTAGYVFEQLKADKDFMAQLGKARMEMITGGGGKRASQKTRIVQDFAPKANKRKDPPGKPIQLLISTDVLSEGQNLQDCGFLINYDLHFNPVRMIQRNGRIDRLFSDHKEITIANFFPEGELEEHLNIVSRLRDKIRAIQDNLPTDSSVIGEPVRVFSLEELRSTRQGDASIIDKIDAENPINVFHHTLDEVVKMLVDFGIDEIKAIPYGCQSNKYATRTGVFVCVIAGPQEDPKRCWWFLYPDPDDLSQQPMRETAPIFELIRSSKPADREMNHPDQVARPIHWNVILDAERRCREMLVQESRHRQQGQRWARGHVNRRIQEYFAPRPEPLPQDIERRLGRYSLEAQREKAEQMLRQARDSHDAGPLTAWLDTALPSGVFDDENPETMHIELVAYLELVPETQRTLPI